MTIVSNGAELQIALANATPGDTIELAPGDYGDVVLDNFQFDGTVTIRSQDAANPATFDTLHIKNSSFLTFENVAVHHVLGEDEPDWSAACRIDKSDHISIIDSEFSGTDDGNFENDGQGLLVLDSSNVALDGNVFHDLNNGAGIGRSENVTVSDNELFDLRCDGITLGTSSHILIENNSIHDFHPAEGDHPDLIQIINNDATGDMVDIVIRGNTLAQGAGGDVQAIFIQGIPPDEVGTSPYVATDFVITDNTISVGSAQGIWVADVIDVQIAGNIVTAVANHSLVPSIRTLRTTDAVVTGNTAPLIEDVDSVGTVASDNTLIGTSDLQGTEGNDTIYGTPDADEIDGAAGADELHGADGDDILHGGDGGDRLFGEYGNDVIYGDGGDDMLNGGAGTDELHGGEGADGLFGGGGADLLYGDNGDDAIFGDGGDDVLLGGAGADELYGGDGNDTFLVIGGGDGFDIIVGGSGFDTILGSAFNDVIGLAGNIDGIEAIDGGSGNDTIRLTSGADTLDLSGVAITGIELIDAGAGNDSVSGSAGDDTIRGNAGNDVLHGGDGNDVFTVVGGGDGYDLFIGGSGFDTILGSAFNDVIGLAGNIDGIEAIDGGSGNDTIRLTSGADTLDLSGVTVTGIELIDAGAGNDTITSSSSDDYIKGGTGSDTFIFNESFGHDTIADFSLTSGDIIDLSAAGFADFADLMAHTCQDGSSAIITTDEGQSLTLLNVEINSLTADLFII